MKIEVEFDDGIIQSAVVDAVKESFTRYNGTARGIVAMHVERFAQSEATLNLVRKTVESEMSARIVEEVKSEVQQAVKAIAKRHAKRRAELREAEIIGAVASQMELETKAKA